jgi:hypothetical protein
MSFRQCAYCSNNNNTSEIGETNINSTRVNITRINTSNIRENRLRHITELTNRRLTRTNENRLNRTLIHNNDITNLNENILNVNQRHIFGLISNSSVNISNNENQIITTSYNRTDILRRLNNLQEQPQNLSIEYKIEPPDYLLDPITLSLIDDPVITPKGITYDKNTIINWLNTKLICPCTKSRLNKNDLIPNRIFKEVLDNWKKDNVI